MRFERLHAAIFPSLHMNNSRITGQLIIYSCAYASDGGPIYLNGKDGSGKDVEIVISQHHIPSDSGKKFIPGRLHLNGVPIDIRSAEEKEIIAKLIWARIVCSSTTEGMVLRDVNTIILGSDILDYFSAINHGEHYAIAYTIKEIVEYIISDEYTRLALDKQ